MTGERAVGLRKTGGGGGLGRRKWARWTRRGLQLALVVAGFVVFKPATDDSLSAGTANLHFAEGLPIWLVAAMVPLWVAPEHGLAEPLRFRRRHRRVAWRIAFLVLFAASLALLANAYWQYRWGVALDGGHFDAADAATAHARVAGRVGLWLACLWPLPGLADPLVWRLWPETVRRAVRCARAAEALAEPTRAARAIPLDPDRGRSGRPETALHEDREGGVPSPLECSAALSEIFRGRPWPHREDRSGPRRAPGTGAVRPGVELRWDGSELTVLDRTGTTVPVPLAGRGRVQGEGRSGRPDAGEGRIGRPVEGEGRSGQPGAGKGRSGRSIKGEGRSAGEGRSGQPVAGEGRIRRPVAELVWFEERRSPVRSAPARWATTERCLVFLDADGFRVGTIRRIVDDWQPVALVARAAGVPFAAYDLGTARPDASDANDLLFPRRGCQLRVFAD